MAHIKKRKSSQLWGYFEELDSSFARCNMCRAQLSYKTSTTNLMKHLKNKHPKLEGFLAKKEQVTVIDISKGQNEEIEEAHQPHENPGEQNVEFNRISSDESPKVPKVIGISEILKKQKIQNRQEELDADSVVINLKMSGGNYISRSPQDKFSIYGEFVASELRSFKDPKYAVILAETKQKINTVLYEADIHRLRLDGLLSSRSSSPAQAYTIQLAESHSEADAVVTEIQPSDACN